jgi:anti-sigma B factor antagonist
VTSERHGEAVVITATGELDLAVVGQMEEALAEEALDGAGSVVVDLTGLEFMDSSGLRALLLCSERLGRRSTPWAVAVEDGSAVRRLLDLSEVAGRLPLASSRDKALASAGSDGGSRS